MTQKHILIILLFLSLSIIIAGCFMQSHAPLQLGTAYGHHFGTSIFGQGVFGE